MSSDPIPSARSDGALSISPEQRDLLFEGIFRNLTGVVDALLQAVWHGKWDKANGLGHNLRDDLIFVIEDLGWGGKSDAGPIEITTPPDMVRAVLERLRTTAEKVDPEIDLRDSAIENSELMETCSDLLSRLGAQDVGVTRQVSQDSGRPPQEGRPLAQREVLIAALKAHPRELSRAEIVESVSENFMLPVEVVDSVVDELLRMDLIEPGRSGYTASPGLLVVNKSWGDLTPII